MPAGESLVESLGKTCTRYKMKTGAEMNKLMTNCAAGIQREIKVKGQKLDTVTSFKYSLIPKKCQGGDKYALLITVKFDQSTRKFGRISFARLYAYCSTSLENIGILTLPPVIITVVNVDTSKKNMHLIMTAMRFCAQWCSLRYFKFRRQSDSNSVNRRS